MKAFKLLSSKVDIRSIHLFKFLVVCFSLVYNKYSKQGEKRQDAVLVYEYKLAGSPKQYAAIDEAIRIVQFIRNKCLRKWMDSRGVSNNDLQGRGVSETQPANEREM